MRVEISRQIDAPIGRVYEVFTDLHRAAERVSGIESAEVLTDGPFGVGTRWTETRLIMGKASSETMWITAVDPPRSYTAEAESCGTHYTNVFLFEVTDSGTRVSTTFSGRPVKLWAWLIAPMGLLMCGTIRKMVAQDLADLAAVCEAS